VNRKKIANAISKAVHILVVGHRKPDGDAIGSILALSHFFDSQNKRHKLFCVDPPGSDFAFLSGFKKISHDPNIFREKRFDLIIVCDSSDLVYAGIDRLINEVDYPYTLVNIDHHKTNSFYGDINLVEPEMSSNTQILYRFFECLEAPLTRDMATCLLTGIVTDTGCFSNQATNFKSLEYASILQSKGARLYKITQYLERNKSISTLKFWGNVLSRLFYNPRYGIAVALILEDDFRKYAQDEKAAAGIANFLNGLEGVKAVMVLKESKGGEIRGSLRTTLDEVDVSKIAGYFGGGGHAKAAGFTVKGELKRQDGRWRII